MLNQQFIDDLVKQLGRVIPQGLRDLDADVQRNVRGVVQAALAKLDLVTQEEFQVQTKVLARTRAKLEALEKHVTQLEEDLLSQPSEKTPPSNTES